MTNYCDRPPREFNGPSECYPIYVISIDSANKEMYINNVSPIESMCSSTFQNPEAINYIFDMPSFNMTKIPEFSPTVSF